VSGPQSFVVQVNITTAVVMDEAAWCEGADPLPMLDLLLRRQGSARKWRLLVCAVCRALWGMLADPRSRGGVEVGELVADGLMGDEQREMAYRAGGKP
jgi:hypothetical protein